MLSQERFNLILQTLEQKKAVTVVELTKLLDTSESTIRRDLNTLHNMGKLNKVHGGATVLGGEFTSDEYDVETKLLLNTSEKEHIGRYAATIINDDDFVFIDAGTTTFRLIDFIENTKAIYVTNGIVHAKKLIQKRCKTIVIGGNIKPSTEAIVGAEGILNLKKYNFSKCFLGVNGITIENGFTTPDVEEALLKEEALKRSYMSFVLADSSKFGKTSSVTFADISQACIITDRIPDDKYTDYTVIREVLKWFIPLHLTPL